MNRAIARRTLFTDRADIRFFLSRLAWEVRRRRLEVHAYAILTTHYHLLVRSPHGTLSEAMRVAQNEYVRRFNRRKRRDGGLLRGRFRSRPIDSLLYWDAVVRYIDANPVSAGLASRPEEYPYGSARAYMGGCSPQWLQRSCVEARVAEVLGEARPGPTGYARVFGIRRDDPSREVVLRRIESPTTHGTDLLDALVGRSTPELLARLRHKARVADGTAPGPALVGVVEARAAVARLAAVEGGWRLPTRGRPDAWEFVLIGLLRDACALSFAEIGGRVRCSTPSATRRYARHRELLLRDDTYARRVAQATQDAVRSCFGVSTES